MEDAPPGAPESAAAVTAVTFSGLGDHGHLPQLDASQVPPPPPPVGTSTAQVAPPPPGDLLEQAQIDAVEQLGCVQQLVPHPHPVAPPAAPPAGAIDPKVALERAVDLGVIRGVAPFAATALTLAKTRSAEAMRQLCRVFKGEHPCTPQPDFIPFALGNHWILSAGGVEGADEVDNTEAFWWINFCGGGEKMTVAIEVDRNPVVLRLSYVTGNPQPRSGASPPGAPTDGENTTCPTCLRNLSDFETKEDPAGRAHPEVCGLTAYRFTLDGDVEEVNKKNQAHGKTKKADRGDVNQFVIMMRAKRSKKRKDAPAGGAGGSA